jgi:hypothetical protein
MKYITSLFTHHAQTSKKAKTRKVSSKNVQYSMFDTDGGWGYFYFTNNETQFNYETTIELTSSRNVKIVYPGQRNKISMTINPRESSMVIYEATGFPYSTAMKIASSFSPYKAAQDMMTSTISTGKKTIMDNNITQTTSSHEDGYCIVFENKSRDLYQLLVEFELDRCHIQGKVGNSVSMMIMPFKSHTVVIRKDAYASDFKAKVSHCEGNPVTYYGN